MSWSEFLLKGARRTAQRRKRIYDLDPSPDVSNLLDREKTSLNPSESFRLLIYISFCSPWRPLKLAWLRLTDQDTPVRRHQIRRLAQELQARLDGSTVITGYFERRNYSRDLARVPAFMEKLFHRTTPCLVVQPQDEGEIAEVLAFCSAKGLAVFPRGTASFAFGGAVPTKNGVVIDLSPQMAVLELDPEKRLVRVQPGARWADIAARTEPFGLVPFTCPTSRFSTVAGWLSTGGMGLDSFAYGSVFQAVEGVRVARADGRIEELNSQTEAIHDLFGTEGQFGVLTEITLRLRPLANYDGSCLLTFDSPEQALRFAGALTTNGQTPSHVVFFDRAYMIRENLLFREHSGLSDPIVPEQDTLLLHFEEIEAEERFRSSLNGDGAHLFAGNRAAPVYLWSDRYFPLKAQRLSSGLLGSEVVLPPDETPRYLKKIKQLARFFKISPTSEVIVCREGEDFSHLVIVAFNCDYTRRLNYALSLLFIQLCVGLAVSRGGFPYGIGIWNTPFIKHKFGKGRLAHLKRQKKETDPEGILSPNKFFRIKGRFFNLPALALGPVVFRAILTVCRWAAPLLGLIARFTAAEPIGHWDIPSSGDAQGKRLLRESSLRCTACGACISVCPAYYLTHDELVTGRTKLRMAEAMLNGGPLQPADAFTPFQCLHCGLCEEVCQTGLPLRDCYLVLENWIERRFGSPQETVKSFVEHLEQNRDLIFNIFGLDLPEWRPDEKLSRVPAIEPPRDGEEA